jgi:hypothetical protein
LRRSKLPHPPISREVSERIVGSTS